MLISRALGESIGHFLLTHFLRTFCTMDAYTFVSVFGGFFLFRESKDDGCVDGRGPCTGSEFS